MRRQRPESSYTHRFRLFSQRVSSTSPSIPIIVTGELLTRLTFELFIVRAQLAGSQNVAGTKRPTGPGVPASGQVLGRTQPYPPHQHPPNRCRAGRQRPSCSYQPLALQLRHSHFHSFSLCMAENVEGHCCSARRPTETNEGSFRTYENPSARLKRQTRH